MKGTNYYLGTTTNTISESEASVSQIAKAIGQTVGSDGAKLCLLCDLARTYVFASLG